MALSDRAVLEQIAHRVMLERGLWPDFRARNAGASRRATRAGHLRCPRDP